MGNWAGVPGNGLKRGRDTRAYRRLVEEVRDRVRHGEPCYLCGDPIDLTLYWRSGGAFTSHHLARLMDGGAAVPDPALMVPAHRACNARDGLRAQNARRAARKAGLDYQPPVHQHTERHSRPW